MLQQRDDNPNIVNPGLISMFGGTLHKDESPEQALKRELYEELELNISESEVEKLGVFYKTQNIDGVDYEIHVYLIKNVAPERVRLNEGKGILDAPLEVCLENKNLTRIARAALEYLKDKKNFKMTQS